MQSSQAYPRMFGHRVAKHHLHFMGSDSGLSLLVVPRDPITLSKDDWGVQ